MDDKYHLYAVHSRDIGPEERHYLITADYALLYTRNKPPESNKEIRVIANLPELVKQWLNGCIDEIRAEYLNEHRQEFLEKTKEFLAAFRQELELEKAEFGGVSE